MVTFKLWLHSIHGSSERKLSPLYIKEVGLCDSAADRVSHLADTLLGVSELSHPTLDDSFEVSLTVGGLYVLDKHGETCLWLPLASSTVVHRESAHTRSLKNRGSTAGLLAYSAPVAPQAFAWGTMKDVNKVTQPEEAEHVWVFIVTSALGSSLAGNAEAQASILQMAMEEFGAHGAIRGDVAGLRSTGVTLGAGAFASVQLMERDLQVHLDAVDNHSQSRMSSEVRMKMTRAERHTAGKRALAAKVITAKGSGDEVFAEASYLVVVAGHPNVTHFFGIFCLTREEEEPSWVLMTEAHENGSLQNLIDETTGLPLARALRYVGELLQALVHVHSFDIIHRDVKSENIILSAGDRAVLIDFGIATHTSQTSRMLIKCGTPGSIAPEYLREGECSVKGDVFGAGIVFYQALSGIRPLDRGGKIKTLKANAKAKIPYDLECFTRHRPTLTGLLRMMLCSSSTRRHTSLVASEIASTLLTSREAFEAPALPASDLRAEPPAEPAEEARAQAPVRPEGLQHMRPSPRARMHMPLRQDEQQASSSVVELAARAAAAAANAQRQKAWQQNSHVTAAMRGEDRNEQTPSRRSERSATGGQADDAPVFELLREYRRKLSLKDGNALSSSSARRPERADTASSASSRAPSVVLPASSSSSRAPSAAPASRSSSRAPSVEPRRASKRSNSFVSYIAGVRNMLSKGTPDQGNQDTAPRHSFERDEDEMSDRASIVSSMVSDFSFASDLIEEWQDAVP
eukprot:TRINITY_DN8441_c0_g1_i1.p1 TRINITY_DN8441_c0_g1~~TRINITY_DN8441_c0_g1_i1.p1  ORF type:complete len:764 (+),score=82.59 TRINITY_DN8441_c0_g1_i1:58-2292(+)